MTWPPEEGAGGPAPEDDADALNSGHDLRRPGNPAPGPSPWRDLALRLVPDAERRGAGQQDPGSPSDEAGWSELRERVRSYAYRVLHDSDTIWRAELEDVVQEVVLRLQAPNRLRGLAAAHAPAGYMAVFIRNTAANLRARERGPAAQRWAQEEREDVYDAPDPDDLLLAGEIYEALDPDDQELVRLRFWEDRNLRETAAALGISYDAAAKRFQRLLQHLRGRFGDQGDG